MILYGIGLVVVVSAIALGVKLCGRALSDNEESYGLDLKRSARTK